MKKFNTSVCTGMLLLLTGCFSSYSGPDTITSINIIDRNGMSETISKKERLNAFQNTDFLAPQPYQKVLRVYGRDKDGTVHSCITSYHPNGQVKQSLDAYNNRAFGKYLEWHPNGVLKIESTVIGGVADLNTQAEESWLFDGINKAYDDEGHLIAEIAYNKGELCDVSKYYHANGNIWKIVPYAKNALHGTEKVFLLDGSLFQTTEYQNGVKDGISIRYWKKEKIAFKEIYKQGLLMEGEYHLANGKKVGQITGGTGFKAKFGKESLEELHEYKTGLQEGVVKVFDEKGFHHRVYTIQDGEKHGQEMEYFPKTLKPKLLITWNHGVMQGTVKTWYEGGHLQSLTEMSQNKKNGHYTAWYRDGSLMLVEEYENDMLTKGEYYRANEKTPLSKIEKGKGIATLFDGNGNFAKKITYQEGKPLD